MNTETATKFKDIEQRVLAAIMAITAEHGMRATVTVHEKYPASVYSVSTLVINAHIYA